MIPGYDLEEFKKQANCKCLCIYEMNKTFSKIIITNNCNRLSPSNLDGYMSAYEDFSKFIVMNTLHSLVNYDK